MQSNTATFMFVFFILTCSYATHLRLRSHERASNTTSNSIPFQAWLGKEIHIVNSQNKMCMLSRGVNKSVYEAECTVESTTEYFKLKQNGSYFLVLLGNGKLAIDNGGSTHAGTSLRLQEVTGHPTQQFAIEPISNQTDRWRLRQINSSLCVSHKGYGGPGQRLVQTDCTNHPSQIWYFQNKPASITPPEIMDTPLVDQEIFIINLINRRCLNFEGVNQAIKEQNCNHKSISQTWRIRQVGHKYQILTSNGVYSWDNNNSKTSKDPMLIKLANSSQPSQILQFSPWENQKGIFHIHVDASGKCLDHKGNGGVGSIVGQWSCNSFPDQGWVIAPKHAKSLYRKIDLPYAKNDVRIINLKSGLCAQYDGEGKTPIEKKCSSDFGQVWRLIPHQNYFLIARQDKKLAWDSEGLNDSTSPLILGKYKHEDLSQHFYLIPFPGQTNTFFIKNLESLLCLDHPGRGSKIHYIGQWHCTGSRDQAWVIKEFPKPDPLPFIGRRLSLINQLTNNCIEQSSNKTGLVENKCNGNSTQIWNITRKGRYLMISNEQGTLYWDNNKSRTDNTLFKLIERNQTGSQYFYITPFNGQQNVWRIKNALSNRCVNHGANHIAGSSIVQSRCSAHKDQGWIVKEVASSRFTINGTVFDSMTGEGINKTDDLIVQFSLGFKVINATILPNGKYTVEIPSPGRWKRYSYKTGYIIDSKFMDIEESSDEFDTNNRIILTPFFDGEWRFVLSWGNKPSDLDARIILPDGSEVNYRNRSGENGNVTLDVDSRYGYGIETITIRKPSKGRYWFYVYNYSNDGLLKNSMAIVRIYYKNRFLKAIKMSNTPRDPKFLNWNVFRINTIKGSLSEINTVSLFPQSKK